MIEERRVRENGMNDHARNKLAAMRNQQIGEIKAYGNVRRNMNLDYVQEGMLDDLIAESYEKHGERERGFSDFASPKKPTAEEVVIAFSVGVNIVQLALLLDFMF